MSRVLYCLEAAFAIYLRWASPPTSIVLPSGVCRQRHSDGPPSDAGIRGLSSSEVHGADCHQPPGELLPHLLTLTSHTLVHAAGAMAGIAGTARTVRRRLFSSALLSPRGLLPVKKRNALCCPDFPLAPRPGSGCGRRHRPSAYGRPPQRHRAPAANRPAAS